LIGSRFPRTISWVQVLQKILYGAPLDENAAEATADGAAGTGSQETLGSPGTGGATRGPASGLQQQSSTDGSGPAVGGPDGGGQRKDGNVSSNGK
jgi:hypothetical protein